jgi:hypothetical protein
LDVTLIAETVSELSGAPLQLPPISDHRSSPGEHPGYSQSPISSGFGASTTSLHSTHTTPPGHYASHNGELPTPSPSQSRRSSFDSRLGNLALSSPVNGTPAASQVSLNSTLLNSNRDSLSTQMQRDRGIQGHSPHQPTSHLAHDDRPSSHGSHHNSNPFGFRNEPGQRTSIGRTAPPIVGSSRYPYGQAAHPNAPSPTKGSPWAFPDPEIIEPSRQPYDSLTGRTSTSSLPGSSSGSIYNATGGILTPHNSHPQIPSSLGPNGQLPPPHIGATHHHHSLTARRPSLLSEQQPTPYSRTPELRVSHKLAERKRRKEMKELFDELRDQLPAERGGKSSKWEVLTKGKDLPCSAGVDAGLREFWTNSERTAIEYVNQQKEAYNDQKRMMEKLERDVLRMQKEIETLRSENQHYRHIQHQQPPPTYHSHPNQHPNQHSHDNNSYNSQPMGNDMYNRSNQPNDPTKMMGVEPC